MDHLGFQEFWHAGASIITALRWLHTPEAAWWAQAGVAAAIGVPAVRFLATGRKATERRHWRM